VELYLIKARNFQAKRGKGMKIVFHEDYCQVYAADPAASAGRMEAIMKVVEPTAEVVQAASAKEKWIAAIHTKAHMERIKGQGVYDVAALAAGGAVMAAEIGLGEPCFGVIRPPGHHASSDFAWGFCYFNNMAVALNRLKKRRRIRRAYVLDIDLHFGDGTVNILGGQKGITVHNVSSGNRETYLEEVEREMDRCEADIIGISAGFDNHEDDWGGTLKTDDYYEIGRMVRRAAGRNRGGCFALLEGGYNYSVLGQNVLSLMEGLSGE
jgi:acetoin utilization deacetylase AcuC-like enzyme